MPTLALIAHRRFDDIVAYRDGRSIPVRQFLADVEWIAAQLPFGQHVLNTCNDRYRCTVVLAAGIVSGRVSLLPSTHTPEMVRQMRRIAPDVFCVTDQDDNEVELPTFRFPPGAGDAARERAIPQIDASQVVAHVFTSGSTGLPLPHAKRWGNLVRSVRAEAGRLGITAAHTVLGTVPAQHMYGLESTVVMPLQAGAALHAGRPFYPADICAALNELPRPRLLVTTPFHLRALLAEQEELPAVDQMLSATAPLSQHLAHEAETRFDAPLFEIYGCTEAGQIASRRTTAGAQWQTLAGTRLRRDGDHVWAEGDYIDSATCLSDVIELQGEDESSTIFLLHGRHADLVNVAGKRTSLGYLNFQLNAIPGVKDGMFLFPQEENADGVTRLSALVVAPGMTPSELISELRQRIDPVFLPRPLLFVDELPRNATGKCPQAAAHELFARAQAAVEIRA